jgi:hypothetical protein
VSYTRAGFVRQIFASAGDRELNQHGDQGRDEDKEEAAGS